MNSSSYDKEEGKDPEVEEKAKKEIESEFGDLLSKMKSRAGTWRPAHEEKVKKEKLKLEQLEKMLKQKDAEIEKAKTEKKQLSSDMFMLNNDLEKK